eukprot:12098.XXX_156490_156762_1 [CDS] Oithona nana genome sequencing.
MLDTSSTRLSRLLSSSSLAMKFSNSLVETLLLATLAMGSAILFNFCSSLKTKASLTLFISKPSWIILKLGIDNEFSVSTGFLLLGTLDFN